MDEIVDNLWLSGIRAAVDDECLAKNNIGYVLTALRGPLTWPFPLKLFHAAAFQPSSQDRATRSFYLERTVHSILKGEKVQRAMPAEYAAPSPQSTKKRRIRCRLCREELASAEHMMHSWRPTSGSRPASELDTPGSNSDAPSSPLAIAKLSEDIMRGLKQGTAGNVPPGALGVEVKQATLDAQLAQVTPTSPSSNPEPPPSPPPFPMRTTRTIVPPASRPPVQRPGPRRQGGVDDGSGAAAPPSSLSPPVQDSGITPAAEVGTPPAPMIDPACSGYFVEPMKWMEESSFAYGQIDGRILCPNSKCGAKLGNYAWAGVRCSCGEWVTPGFCIHKTRVDELWN
ncbi:hypothetical protein FRC05_011619 [Tulasnella sp. 425]|nr:hypothetical protein FRC05_011619 [Tulasnella sp. 425]